MMVRFSAHLEINFGKEHSFEERWIAASNSGFAGCELVWRLHELQEVARLQENHPMQVTSLGGTSGFAPGGGRPVLTRPEDREWLVRDVKQAIEYAQSVHCLNLVFVPGNLVPGWSIEQHRQEAVESFKLITPLLEEAGVTALLEPLNSKVDHKGIYCDTSAEAFRIIEQVGSPHVKVLYDVYHMQIMEGNLIDTIRKHHSVIGYYHIAKVPGRTEPVGGEIHLPAVLEAIEETGYEGFIGLEYKSSGQPADAYEAIKRAYPGYVTESQASHRP